MSKKVYLIQNSANSLGHYIMHPQSARQAIIPQVVRPARLVKVVQNDKLITGPITNDMLEAIETECLPFENKKPKAPRKRERLTHLTQEEKLNRRKMKNREAAQNARDRKKEQTRTMEETLRRLVVENRRLRAENAQLRADMSKCGCIQQPISQLSIPTSDYETSSSNTHSPSSTPMTSVGSSTTHVESAVDGCDEAYYSQSPLFEEPCVEEIYSSPTNENSVDFTAPQQGWTVSEVPPTGHDFIPNATNFVNELPPCFTDDQALQAYDDLVTSPFVNELCQELDSWDHQSTNEVYFNHEQQVEMPVEKQQTAAYTSQNNEMNSFDDIDLFEFCNF